MRAVETHGRDAVSSNLSGIAGSGVDFLSPNSSLQLTPEDVAALGLWVEDYERTSSTAGVLEQQLYDSSSHNYGIVPPEGYNFWGAHAYERHSWLMYYEIYIVECGFGIFFCEPVEHHEFRVTINPGNYMTQFNVSYARNITTGRVGLPSFVFGKWDNAGGNGSHETGSISPGFLSVRALHLSSVINDATLETVETEANIDGIPTIVYLHGGANWCVEPVKDPWFDIPACIYEDTSDT